MCVCVCVCGFPGGSDDKIVYLQCRRLRFHPWVGKIPWRKECQPTPVSLPGEFHGQRSIARLQSTRLQRVRHDMKAANTFTFMVYIHLHILNLLMMVKEESEKTGLKISIKNSKITATSPIISWQIKGIKWKQ